MSWRLLFATLLVAVGAAAWGGLQLGDWLVAHAPQAAPAPGQEENEWSQQPVLDANGRPYVAQPPQPRVDGTLGVPERPATPQWTIPTVSLFDTVTDPAVQISRENVTMDQARQIAENSDVPLPNGSSDVTTLDLAMDGQAAGGPPAPQQGPIQAAPGVGLNQQPLVAQSPGQAAMPQQPVQGAAPQDWQAALRHELAVCADKGFFERPSCSWNARNRYCAPNRAWGTIAECPPRP